MNYLGKKPLQYLESSVLFSTLSDKFNPLVSITAASRGNSSPEQIFVTEVSGHYGQQAATSYNYLCFSGPENQNELHLTECSLTDM